MTDNYERCSCGARYKSKCVKESVSGSGKMCVKASKSTKIEDIQFVYGCHGCGEVFVKSDLLMKHYGECVGFEAKPLVREYILKLK